MCASVVCDHGDSFVSLLVVRQTSFLTTLLGFVPIVLVLVFAADGTRRLLLRYLQFHPDPGGMSYLAVFALPVLWRLWPSWALAFVAPKSAGHEYPWDFYFTSWSGPGIFRAFKMTRHRPVRQLGMAPVAGSMLAMTACLWTLPLSPDSLVYTLAWWATFAGFVPTAVALNVVYSERGFYLAECIELAEQDERDLSAAGTKERPAKPSAPMGSRTDDGEARSRRPGRRGARAEVRDDREDLYSRESLISRCGREELLFYCAAQTDDPKRRDAYLNHARHPNARGEYDQTALHVALRRANGPVVKRLLELNADVTLEDRGGSSAMHYLAMKKSNLAFLPRVLDLGGDIDALANDGRTPILWAVGSSCLPAVEELVRRGAYLGAETTAAENALHIAAAYTLRPSDKNKPKTLREHLKILDVLITRGLPLDAPNRYGDAPLHLAAARGMGEVVERLVARGANVNRLDKQGRSALQLTALFGRREHAEHLGLSNTKDLRAAIAFGLDDTARQILNTRGGAVDRGSYGMPSPLAIAVHADNLVMVRELLERGAPLDGRTSCSSLVLCSIRHAENRELTKLLLEQGADVNWPDGDGNSPLHEAVRLEDRSLVALLLEHGADPSAKTERGYSVAGPETKSEIRQMLKNSLQ